MCNMIRYRIFLLLPALLTPLESRDAPDKQVLTKSTQYSNHSSSKTQHEDLAASATEFRAPKYLPPANRPSRSKNCYDCNHEPWIPIVGRSLSFQTHTEEGINKKFQTLIYPQIDQYGAPQGSFELPPIGEVVDFMLPPPYKSGSITSGLGDVYNFNFGPPRQNFGPVPSFRPIHPFRPSNNNYGPPRQPIPTTYLRPVAQDFQPPSPQPGINHLPLENHLFPPQPMPSDSYGRPLLSGFNLQSDELRPPPPPPTKHNIRFPPPPPLALPLNNYVAPLPDAITHGSGDSEEAGTRFTNLLQNGLTDVQLVPSINIADYTASIEHPINLIQSPILDLNINSFVDDKIESRNKLSENPIVVDDTFTSASDINSTYSSGENLTTIKRHNDKFIGSFENQLEDIDLTDNLIQKLLLEHNIIEDPKTQIVGIKKTTIDPQKVSTNFNLGAPSIWHSTLPTAMMPPKPVSTTWMAPVNKSFAKPNNYSKMLQIIVPYLRSPDNHPQPSTGLYNKEYSTLAPVFVPPPVTSEASNLWTRLVEETPSSSTEAYNINDYLAKRPYDILSLQKNIDDWTHQSYSNRYSFGDKIGTKLSYVKKIPGEYLTTTIPNHANKLKGDLRAVDHEASSSDKREFISNEIEDAAASTEAPQVRFIVKKSAWEENKVTLSNSTHEKIYLVTPQSYARLQTSTPATAFSMAPRIQNGRVNNVASMTRISVRVEAPKEDVANEKKPIRVIYSEWPHLINDLETTTTQRSTSRHPLFGLIDLAPFTLSSNSTVETISGHSKVSTMVTSPLTRPSSTTPMPISETVKVLPEAA